MLLKNISDFAFNSIYTFFFILLDSNQKNLFHLLPSYNNNAIIYILLHDKEIFFNFAVYGKNMAY